MELKVFIGLIQKKIKQIPQYLHFRCGMNHWNYSLKKLSKTFKLPKELMKTEMDHNEVYSDTRKDKNTNG